MIKITELRRQYHCCELLFNIPFIWKDMHYQFHYNGKSWERSILFFFVIIPLTLFILFIVIPIAMIVDLVKVIIKLIKWVKPYE